MGGIWVPWRHRGHLMAERISSLALLDCSRLQVVLSKAGGPLVRCLRTFALLNLDWAQKREHEETRVTDLQLDADATADLAKRTKSFHRNAGNRLLSRYLA